MGSNPISPIIYGSDLMEIRKMEEKDVEQVYDIGIKVKEFVVSENRRFWSKQTIYDWTNRKNDILLIAEDDEKIIGFMMSRFHEPTKEAIIDNIFVSEDWRGRGVGTELVKECLKQLKEKGTNYVYCTITTDNTPTIEFLKKNGFNKGYEFIWMDLFLE